MKYLILAALFIADISFADGTQEFTVVNVGVVRSAGYAFINITPDQSVSNCARKNQLRWELTTDADKAILSLVITAHSTDKKLKIALLDGDCLGDSARPNVVYIMKD